MNEAQITLLKTLNIELDEDKINLFEKYAQIFLEKNSFINLISKNDAKLLFEKHIFDSLAINKFLNPKDNESLLDIGTGGGFPSIPIAILYENLNVCPIDSIRKKINIIEEIKTELNLKNIFTICDRAENVRNKYDYVTTRAVASLDIILKYAIPKLKDNGYFIAYKSQKADDEIKEAQNTMKTLKVEIADIIEYLLPLEDAHERKLIIFKKVS